MVILNYERDLFSSPDPKHTFDKFYNIQLKICEIFDVSLKFVEAYNFNLTNFRIKVLMFYVLTR